MALVIVLTNKINSHLEEIMIKALEKNMCVKKVTSISQTDNLDKSAFVLVSTDGIIEYSFDNTITVFDSSYKGRADNIKGVSIVSACCDGALKSIAMSDCTAITCGTSPLDTLSIASCEEGNVLVSLQRELKTLTGDVIEPCDIRIKTDEPVRIYPTLAACAVLLLSDVPYENGYEV